MKRYVCLTTALLITMVAVVASANDVVERQHAFDATGISRLGIENGVGNVTVVPSDLDAIEVELRLEPHDNGGWFRRAPDLHDMDLRARTRSERLTLTFKERHVVSHWVVRVPASLRELTIDAGVGEVQGRLPSVTATVNLGVGSVHLQAERTAVGVIDLHAGVGDTRIIGGAENDGHRAFVSSTSSGRGDGGYAIEIKVGVGDAAVELR